jgi:triosephosphate isomerase
MKQLIAANWKMNGMPDWADKPKALHEQLGNDPAGKLLICPPHALIGHLAQSAATGPVVIGAQDCSEHKAGAHTGETDADLLVALGASYVILGHSERRAAGETDVRVKAKAERAVSSGLRPIICVGESLDQRESGEALSIVKDQLKASLPREGEYDIAYEPIWAIGTGKVAEIDDIADMHVAIRKAIGAGPRILYGGSVKPGNAGDILALAEVGGALVGGASLDMESFAAIAQHARSLS